MTELEKLAYTKEFIDKLANGINPLDDTPIPEGDIMNNLRLARCMFYVSDILRQVIENGGTEKRRKKEKTPFSLTEEQRAKYIYDCPIAVTELANRIYALAENEAMEKMCYRHITSWLLDVGLLNQIESADGKKKKLPTQEGNIVGIYSETRKGRAGDYDVILYSKEAQQFIIDNIEAIVSFNQK